MTRIHFSPNLPGDSQRPEPKDKGVTVFPKLLGPLLERLGIAMKHTGPSGIEVYVSKKDVQEDLKQKLSVLDNPEEAAKIQELFEEKTADIRKVHEPPDISKLMAEVIKDYFSKKSS